MSTNGNGNGGEVRETREEIEARLWRQYFPEGASVEGVARLMVSIATDQSLNRRFLESVADRVNADDHGPCPRLIVLERKVDGHSAELHDLREAVGR